MKTRADWRQLLEALHKDLSDAERELKQFVRSSSSARDPSPSVPGKAPSQPGKAPDAVSHDPFQARAVAAAVQAWVERVVPDVTAHAAALATAAGEAAVRAEIDFWADLEEHARRAGFACQTAPTEGEATVESYASLKVDLKKCSARVNGRAINSIHVPLVWRVVEEEVARIKAVAMPPERFVVELSRAVRALATKGGSASEPVPVLDALKQLQESRGAGGDKAKGAAHSRQVFTVELAWLADARPAPADDEGMTITLEPTTLPKNTIRIYSKRLGDFRRVGRLQRSRVRGS